MDPNEHDYIVKKMQEAEIRLKKKESRHLIYLMLFFGFIAICLLLKGLQ